MDKNPFCSIDARRRTAGSGRFTFLSLLSLLHVSGLWPYAYWWCGRLVNQAE